MRAIRYHQIADELRREVSIMAAGTLLASESVLSERFAVSRVTIRRALAVLRLEGRITSRQGLGWLAAGEPITRELSTVTTMGALLRGQGREPRREVLDLGTVTAPPKVAALLGCSTVWQARRLQHADGEPLALVVIWWVVGRWPNIVAADIERQPLAELFDVVVGNVRQELSAQVAGEAGALLGIPAEAPVMRSFQHVFGDSGQILWVSEHIYPAHRAEFAVDLAGTAADDLLS